MIEDEERIERSEAHGPTVRQPPDAERIRLRPGHPLPSFSRLTGVESVVE